MKNKKLAETESVLIINEKDVAQLVAYFTSVKEWCLGPDGKSRFQML